MTPDCWREQVVMKLLLEGIRPRSVAEAASSAAATAVWLACVRKGLSSTAGATSQGLLWSLMR